MSTIWAPVAFLLHVLAQALACLLEFFALWNLQVEAAKSYCWALTKQDRQQLATFPFQCVASAHELGGILSFTKRASTGLHRKRQCAIADRWQMFKRSWAPLRQKLATIPLVFWSSALHGIHGYCFGESSLDAPRRQAVSALRSNPLLRLTLSTTPQSDPGLWRAIQSLHAFRRLAKKGTPVCYPLESLHGEVSWGALQRAFFSAVICYGPPNWRVEPPNFSLTMMDVDITCCNWMGIPSPSWFIMVGFSLPHDKFITSKL